MSPIVVRFRHTTRTAVGLGILCGLVSMGFTACGKDSAKCQQGQDGVRQSLKAEDSALVTRWREYAYKYCSDKEKTTLANLDREIADGLAASEKRKSGASQKRQESLSLLGAFTGWVAGARGAPETASASPSCEGGEAEAKSKERWCAARRTAGTYNLDVRYWDKETTAARFTVVMPGPVTCQDLGPHRVIRNWTIPGTAAKRSHCELTGGSLSGMQALVAEAVNGPVEVFSPRYAELDQAFGARVNSEGK